MGERHKGETSCKVIVIIYARDNGGLEQTGDRQRIAEIL